MSIYLIRHADAGHPSQWVGEDRLRPLTAAGRRQAEALAQQLTDARIDAILSSPYARCVQTVEPLARRLKLPIEPVAELAEGGGADGPLHLTNRFSGEGLVCCTHGDVLEALLELLISGGLVSRAGARNEKAGIWVLETGDGRITAASYRSPP